MFIKEIVLDGFKCYEERTVLTNLDRTFNAITGMNGSGKSNVLDGILFVLGLEGTKVLRADSMKELVNVHRRECRVTLVICNREKKRSPLGYEHHDDISISRSVDSEGRSRYYLNNHSCTLSTLNKLCMSMGISSSRGSFSFVVMQGHITKVLSMKSRDLRNLVEETAGTRPYEREKEKAMMALERKESKLKEVRDTLERRISPFYGRLREERAAFLEIRNLEEAKVQLVSREKEIRKTLASSDVCSAVTTLRGYVKSYMDDMRKLEAVEKKIESLHETKGEADILWVKASIDEENLKLGEIRNRGSSDVLRKSIDELNSIVEKEPEYQMDALVTKEKMLLENLKTGIYGGDSILEKFEELTSLKLQRSRLELRLNAVKNEFFSQERLDEIEKLRVDKGELESMRKNLRTLRSKLNYPFMENVFGTVDENIEISDKKYQEAIYTVMGGKAKYVITSDEKVGAFLLKNAEKSTSVIPLSRIKTPLLPSNVLREIRSRNGVNMVDLLKFDNKVRKAIEFVFANFFVFEDKETARNVCFERRVICVTLDGTVYDPKGTLTGGRPDFRSDVIRRSDIEELDRVISELEHNETQFNLLRDEYEILVRRRCSRDDKERIEREMRLIDTKISLLADLCESKMDVKEELRVVREKIIEGNKETKQLALVREKQRVLRKRIMEIEERIRNDCKEERMCLERISSYQKMLGEHDLQNNTRKISEKEAEGLEARRRYLVKGTSKLQSKITKLYNEIEGKVASLMGYGTREEFFDEAMGLEDELINVLRSLNIDPNYFRFRVSASAINDCELKKDLEGVVADLRRCNTVRRSTMNPVNFDLLEKNELMIEELKQKIERLERDKSAIAQSISKLNDLGVEENEKALKHINTRLGRFLQYFMTDSDAKISKEDGEYALKVRIGNWKESLDELSGGQRSLVALCLIFSMLTYKPVPFYIFDEIDSALDLSYTQSIGEIMKNEFNNAQFLVVSLKNGMFDNANSVFKVFLQDGKSKICQIK